MEDARLRIKIVACSKTALRIHVQSKMAFLTLLCTRVDIYCNAHGILNALTESYSLKLAYFLESFESQICN